jgi:hypothetical protein
MVAQLPAIRQRLIKSYFEETTTVLWTIFVILLVLWLLGLVTSYTIGGFIHILLVVAIAIALIQLISGRRAV